MISIRNCIALSRVLNRKIHFNNSSGIIRPEYSLERSAHTLDTGAFDGKRTIYGSGNKRTSSSFAAKQNDGGKKVIEVPNEQASVPVKCPDFRDVKIAYKAKTNRDLLRAFFVFTVCSYDSLLNNQLKILSWARTLVGRNLFRRFMRATIYGQFQGGETDEEIMTTARNIASHGVIPLLSYTAGEVHGVFSIESEVSEKQLWEKNFNVMKHGIDLAAGTRDILSTKPQIAVKFTFFASSGAMSEFTDVINWNEQVARNALTQDKTKGRQEYLSLLADAIGAKDKIGHDMSSMSETDVSYLLTRANVNQDIYTNDKFMKFATSPRPIVSEESMTVFEWLSRYVDELAREAFEKDVTIIVDAEQTYIQPTIETLCLDLMRKYNKEKYTIQPTYQCYLKRTFNIIRRDVEMAHKEGFFFGAKVVRGAYMDEERRLAKEKIYDDPVNESYDATTVMYNKVALYLLNNFVTNPGEMQITFASHSEETMKFLIENIAERGLKPTGDEILLAQIYGMRDHLAYTLGYHGFPGAKLIQYGDIEEGIAFLSRRLLENRSGLPTAEVERTLLKKELKRRFLGIRPKN